MMEAAVAVGDINFGKRQKTIIACALLLIMGMPPIQCAGGENGRVPGPRLSGLPSRFLAWEFLLVPGRARASYSIKLGGTRLSSEMGGTAFGATNLSGGRCSIPTCCSGVKRKPR